MTLHILLLEFEPVEARRLAEDLSVFGHQIVEVECGSERLAAWARDAFDVVILDADFPNRADLSVLGSLRDSGMATPVLLLSTSNPPLDKFECLDAGADDFMVKPADVLELDARLKALVRARKFIRETNDGIRAGDILISVPRVRAWRGEQPLDLALTEFRLLVELVRSAGVPVSRATLIERVWGSDLVPATNIVETYICRLRTKLSRYGEDPIQTIRGIGYSIRV